VVDPWLGREREPAVVERRSPCRIRLPRPCSRRRWREGPPPRTCDHHGQALRRRERVEGGPSAGGCNHHGQALRRRERVEGGPKGERVEGGLEGERVEGGRAHVRESDGE
jgi:hypothetical protein